jgi:hypothetical protein
MGYYDGNTVTALWNYAQHFAMSDNSYGTTFGPSTPGLMNLVAGQTNGVAQHINGTGDETDGGSGTLSVVGDPDPLNDVCANPTRNQVQMPGKNIGDMCARSPRSTTDGCASGSPLGNDTERTHGVECSLSLFPRVPSNCDCSLSCCWRS